MADDILIIQNGSDTPQTVFDEQGRRHTLDAHQVLPYPKKLARLFLTERPKFVNVYTPVNVPELKIGEPRVYIANVTGSPFIADKVAHRYVDKATKLEKTEMIPNPLKTPKPIMRMYSMPQQVIETPGGTKTTLSTPPIQVRIPPWYRLPVPESCAEWLERRDAQQDDAQIGGLIRARPPTEFEPNETWDLHEILVYARMVDDSAQGWVAEKDVWKAIESNDDVKIAELKIKLLNTLFYRLVDERWALPSRSAFEAFLKTVLDAVKKGDKKAIVSAQVST